jgi:hypothetical protein
MLLRAISLAVLLTGSVALADDMKMPLNATDMKWGPAPNVLPKGAQVASRGIACSRGQAIALEGKFDSESVS